MIFTDLSSLYKVIKKPLTIWIKATICVVILTLTISLTVSKETYVISPFLENFSSVPMKFAVFKLTFVNWVTLVVNNSSQTIQLALIHLTILIPIICIHFLSIFNTLTEKNLAGFVKLIQIDLSNSFPGDLSILINGW